MIGHSILPPSSAARRVACPGSWALEKMYPETEDSTVAAEGAAAHWLASEMIKNPEFSAGICPNGEPITEDMIEGGTIYSGLIELISKLANNHLREVEEPVDISVIHPDCWGTPDCWIYSYDTHILHLFDYKYGHLSVEVFENWQLIEYAAGILEKLRINGIEAEGLTVVFYIVQPRSYHREGPIRTWRTSALDLNPYFEILKNAEVAVLQPSAKCIPNPECNFCLARHACESLQSSALARLDVSLQSRPVELSPADVGRELRYLKYGLELLEARVSGLSQQALSLIKSGARVPFFKVESSSGRQKWKVPAATVITMGKIMGHDLSRPAETITPKQALKLGVPEDIVESYSEVLPGGLKLVPENLNLTRKMFGENK